MQLTLPWLQVIHLPLDRKLFPLTIKNVFWKQNQTTNKLLGYATFLTLSTPKNTWFRLLWCDLLILLWIFLLSSSRSWGLTLRWIQRKLCRPQSAGCLRKTKKERVRHIDMAAIKRMTKRKLNAWYTSPHKTGEKKWIIVNLKNSDVDLHLEENSCERKLKLSIISFFTPKDATWSIWGYGNGGNVRCYKIGY